MTKENKRQRKVGVCRSILYGMHREREKLPKISIRLFDIRLTEYETGMLTIKSADPELVKKFL